MFEDDKGFWSAVTSFINNAKCPIIMTSNGKNNEIQQSAVNPIMHIAEYHVT